MVRGAREQGGAVVAVLVLIAAGLLVVGGTRLLGGGVSEKLRCHGEAAASIGGGGGGGCDAEGSAIHSAAAAGPPRTAPAGAARECRDRACLPDRTFAPASGTGMGDPALNAAVREAAGIPPAGASSPREEVRIAGDLSEEEIAALFATQQESFAREALREEVEAKFNPNMRVLDLEEFWDGHSHGPRWLHPVTEFTVDGEVTSLRVELDALGAAAKGDSGWVLGREGEHLVMRHPDSGGVISLAGPPRNEYVVLSTDDDGLLIASYSDVESAGRVRFMPDGTLQEWDPVSEEWR